MPNIVFMRTVLILCLFFAISACKRKWTEKDRSEFVSGCLSVAMKDPLIGDSLARPYCTCLLKKMEQHYPNANDVKYARYDTAIVNMSRDCLKR